LQKTQGWGSLKLWSSLERKRKGAPATRQEVRDLTHGNAAQRRKDRREQERLNPSPEKQEPSKRHNGPNGEGNLGEEKGNQIDMIKKLLGSAAFWTAAFTALLCLFTYLLYDVSKESTNASKEQARAVVSFGGFAIGPVMNGPDGSWQGQQFQLNWFNNGVLPAKTASFQQNAKPFFDDLPKTYDFPIDSDKIQGIVPPKGQFTSTITIPRGALEDNWHGKARIFVWGTVVYKDGFVDDPIRVSEFCTEIYQVTVGYTVAPQPTKENPHPKPPVMGDPNTAIAALSWRACNRGAHSCYDKDCTDYSEQIKYTSR
jgi:hypothetical protein